MGAAEYSCQCRFNAQPFQCKHVPIYDNAAKDYRCQVCGVFTRQQGAPGIGSVPDAVVAK
jgi:hypothetical protein